MSENVLSAQASDLDNGTTDIIVTANRREESLQDVPVAITAISQTQLRAANIVSTQDLPKLTPSLQIPSVGGFALPRIRGVGTSANTPTNENPVALYVDGVYYAQQTIAAMSLNNIEQVEVDKGPQGTLFGRNATGGLIQIRTRDPRAEFGGAASASYENYQTFSGNLYLTGPVVNNVAADIAIYYREQNKGYATNILTGQEFRYQDTFVVRSKWKYTGEATDVTLIGDYIHFAGANGLSPYPGSIPIGGPLPPLRGQDTAVPARFGYSSKQGGVSLNINHDFGGVSLQSTTAYRKSKDGNLFPNISASPAFITDIDLTSTSEQLSQEFQLQSKNDGRLNWTVGTFLFYHRGAWEPAVISGQPLAPLSALVYHSVQKTYSVSAYGQGTYELTDTTRLTLGLRGTSDTRKWEYNLNIIAPFPIPSTADSAKKTFRKITWRGSLDQRFSPDILGYVSVNRGFKSGGFNDFTSPAITYAPETLDAYEVGLKTELFDKMLRLNAAAFLYNYKNVQVSRYVNGIQVVYNGASARVKGLELDGSLRPTNRFRIDFGLTVQDAYYRSFLGADSSAPLPGGGNVVTSADVSGNKLSFSPDFTSNVGASYTAPVPFGNLTFSANYYHNSGFYPEPNNRLRQKSYDLLDANIALESVDKVWRLSVFGRNLTNELYSLSMNSQPAHDGLEYAPPRTYGVKLDYKF